MGEDKRLMTVRVEITLEPTSEHGCSGEDLLHTLHQLKGVQSARVLGTPAIEFVREARNALDQLLKNEEAKARGEKPQPVRSFTGYNKYEV
jgi:hypothetical protein